MLVVNGMSSLFLLSMLRTVVSIEHVTLWICIREKVGLSFVRITEYP